MQLISFYYSNKLSGFRLVDRIQIVQKKFCVCLYKSVEQYTQRIYTCVCLSYMAAFSLSLYIAIKPRKNREWAGIGVLGSAFCYLNLVLPVTIGQWLCHLSHILYVKISFLVLDSSVQIWIVQHGQPRENSWLPPGTVGSNQQCTWGPDSPVRIQKESTKGYCGFRKHS